MPSVCHSAHKQDTRTEKEFIEGHGTVNQMLAVKQMIENHWEQGKGPCFVKYLVYDSLRKELLGLLKEMYDGTKAYDRYFRAGSCVQKSCC